MAECARVAIAVIVKGCGSFWMKPRAWWFAACAGTCWNIALALNVEVLMYVTTVVIKIFNLLKKDALKNRLLRNICILFGLGWAFDRDLPLACRQRRHWRRWPSNIATSPPSSRRVTRSSPGAASLSTPTSRGACAARSRSCWAFLENCAMLDHFRVGNKLLNYLKGRIP